MNLEISSISSGDHVTNEGLNLTVMDIVLAPLVRLLVSLLLGDTRNTHLQTFGGKVLSVFMP